MLQQNIRKQKFYGMNLEKQKKELIQERQGKQKLHKIFRKYKKDISKDKANFKEYNLIDVD